MTRVSVFQNDGKLAECIQEINALKLKESNLDQIVATLSERFQEKEIKLVFDSLEKQSKFEKARSLRAFFKVLVWGIFAYQASYIILALFTFVVMKERTPADTFDLLSQSVATILSGLAAFFVQKESPSSFLLATVLYLFGLAKIGSSVEYVFKFNIGGMWLFVLFTLLWQLATVLIGAILTRRFPIHFLKTLAVLKRGPANVAV